MAAKLMVVTGSREWPDDAEVEMTIDVEVPDLVLHGNARGADRMAETAARRRGMATLPMPADWKSHDPDWCRCDDPLTAKFCKQAGHRRNWDMVLKAKEVEAAGWDVVVHAFWFDGSRGTENMVKSCIDAGLRVVVHRHERSS